jgi:DNA-binding CsgD family transcriptional regulator
VDVFLHDPELSQLRAIATSNTEVSRRQRALGLDRLRLDSGRGRASVVFQTRLAYLSHGVDRDPAELPEMYSELHLRAAVFAPVDIAGRRGVIVARAVDVGQFSCADLAFLEAVASWMGLVGTSMRRADARFDGEEPGAYQQHHDVRSLTPRQREIARLIARGCSNATIARVLVITPGTVANHVAQILNRLDVHNRSQVAVMVAQAARPTLL